MSDSALKQTDHINRMIKLTMITLSGFHCFYLLSSISKYCMDSCCHELFFTTSGFNFIKVLRLRFLYESAWCSFFLVTFWRIHSFVIFGANFLYKKCACKTMMKLTPGVGCRNSLAWRGEMLQIQKII